MIEKIFKYLGLARRALDEARLEMRGKVERYSPQPLLQHPCTQRSLEAAEGLWWACRAGLREALRSAEVVRMACDAAGASAVRRSGVLQRLLRDASGLTHHISVNLASYEQTGPVRSGVDELSLLV